MLLVSRPFNRVLSRFRTLFLPQDSLVQLGLAHLLYLRFNQSLLVQLWDKSILHLTSFAMSTTLESTTANNHQQAEDRKQSPPAFLDLADSVCLISLSAH